eukprot:scaffold17717_cov145-Amphora_coffeaeformis.AAC.1
MFSSQATLIGILESSTRSSGRNFTTPSWNFPKCKNAVTRVTHVLMPTAIYDAHGTSINYCSMLPTSILQLTFDRSNTKNVGIMPAIPV